MGYEAGDPVRVLFPFEREGQRIICEGKVVRVMPNGFLRVAFPEAKEIDGCVIEQVLVDPKHLT